MAEPDSTDRILKWLADTLESGGNFVGEQAPDVVRELVAWNLTVYTLAAVVTGVVAMGLAGAAVVAFRKWPFLDDEMGIIGMISLVASIFFLVPGVVNTVFALKWWIAPKLCVLEWARELMP